MRKQIALIMVTVCVLLMAGCGDSNSSEDSAGTDNQIKMTYVENAGQADTEENISTDGVAESPLDGVTDDAAKSSEAQQPTKEEDWEDKALLEEYAAYGIEKDGDFYYYQGELVYPESVKLIVFICQSTIRLAKSRKCTLIMLNKPVLM